jgi:hypothetical protein
VLTLVVVVVVVLTAALVVAVSVVEGTAEGVAGAGLLAVVSTAAGLLDVVSRDGAGGAAAGSFETRIAPLVPFGAVVPLASFRTRMPADVELRARVVSMRARVESVVVEDAGGCCAAAGLGAPNAVDRAMPSAAARAPVVEECRVMRISCAATATSVLHPHPVGVPNALAEFARTGRSLAARSLADRPMRRRERRASRMPHAPRDAEISRTQA